MSALRYSILDPTGNITAIVESHAASADQPEIAAELMRRHPEVEQVGFLRRFAETGADGAAAALRMAGGEFCGNACMCAAALVLLRQGGTAGRGSVLLRVSGAAEPVEVKLEKEGNGFRAGVRMPPAREIGEREFVFEGLRGRLPVAFMQGISHVLAEQDSVFFPLLSDRAAAERAVRAWCGELESEGLGLMFLEKETRRLTPLVWIPGGGTMFWENSCASGTAAVGMIFAARAGKTAELSLREPGGVLRVTSDPASGETRLCGSLRLIAEF